MPLYVESIQLGAFYFMGSSQLRDLELSKFDRVYSDVVW